MTRYHCEQLFASRRWLLALAMDVFLAVATIIDLKTKTFYILTESHLAVSLNIWDVPFNVCASNSMTIFVLVVMFVFLVGDVFLRDERTSRFPMLFARTNNRATWFVSLIPAIAFRSCSLCCSGNCDQLGHCSACPARQQVVQFLPDQYHPQCSESAKHLPPQHITLSTALLPWRRRVPGTGSV